MLERLASSWDLEYLEEQYRNKQHAAVPCSYLLAYCAVSKAGFCAFNKIFLAPTRLYIDPASVSCL